jgi:hypothetical protein
MKTKKLIELLQAEDPTGEVEVCVNNEDIFFLEHTSAYWDGCLQVLKRDESSPYYNIIGAKIASTGGKIKIKTLSIEDAIYEDPDLPVEFDEYTKKSYADSIARWREEAREVTKKLDNECLVEVLNRYKEGWKAAQAIAEPLTRCNVQWWWKEGDTGTKRLFSDEKSSNIQASLCQGHSHAVVYSKFFKPVNDGQRIVWEFVL